MERSKTGKSDSRTLHSVCERVNQYHFHLTIEYISKKKNQSVKNPIKPTKRATHSENFRGDNIIRKRKY